MRHPLTTLLIRLVAWRAAHLPAAQRHWGEAVVAELAAVPDGYRRLRWAVGSLWFVVSRGAHVEASAPEPTGPSWQRWAAALVGVLTVGPWLAVSVLQLMERDAPDGTARSVTVMLATQVALVAAFLANARRPSRRRSRVVLLTAVVAYGAAAAFGALDNTGELAGLLLAPLLFAGPPLLAALPMLRRAR